MHTRSNLRYFSINGSERTKWFGRIPCFLFSLICTCHLFCVLDVDVKRLVTTIIPCNLATSLPSVLIFLTPSSSIAHSPLSFLILFTASFPPSLMSNISSARFHFWPSFSYPQHCPLIWHAPLNYTMLIRSNCLRVSLNYSHIFLFLSRIYDVMMGCLAKPQTLVAKFFHHTIHPNTTLSFLSLSLTGSIITPWHISVS